MRPLHHHAEAETESRPLTRRNANQNVYQRLPEVEAQIAECARLEHLDLLALLPHDYQDSRHIKDETLCYLIRERLYENRGAEANDLIQVLLERHAGTINRRVCGNVEARHAEDCIREITTNLLMQIFNLETDKGDFAQVRFGLYFERLTTEAIKKFHLLERRERMMSEPRARDDDTNDFDKLDSLTDEKTMPLEKRLMMRDALNSLAPELREVFVLRHYDDWQIEAASPDEPSISRYCQVTPRTVRNRLKQAEAELQNWREGRTK